MVGWHVHLHWRPGVDDAPIPNSSLHINNHRKEAKGAPALDNFRANHTCTVLPVQKKREKNCLSDYFTRVPVPATFALTVTALRIPSIRPTSYL
jgi:hypothetical protein